MICPVCKSPNNDGVMFCGKCGVKIPRCPKCGNVVTKKNMRFCLQDGTEIPTEVLAVFPDEEGNSYSIPKVEKSVNENQEPSVDEMVEEISERLNLQNDTYTEEIVYPVKRSNPAKRKYCLNCGTPFEGEGLTCATCTSEKYNKTEEPKKKKKRIVPFLIGLLIFLLLVGLAVIFIFAKNEGLLPFGRNTDETREAADDYDEDESEDEPDDGTEEESTVEETETERETAKETETIKQTEEAEETTAPQEEEADGEYIFPNSSTELLTDADLSNLNESMLRLARNEIFARHGMIFESDDLKEYFSCCSWYKPSVDAKTMDQNYESIMNEVEKANISKIKKLETGGSDDDHLTYGTWYIVNTDYLSLRKGSNTQSELIRKLYPGDAVEVLDTRCNGFYYVDYNGTKGYLLPSYLEPGASALGDEAGGLKTTTDEITLRDIPSKSGEAFAKIPKGTEVEFYCSAQDGFDLIAYQGKMGYALSEYMR